MKVEFRDLAVFVRDGRGGNPLAVLAIEAVPAERRQETAATIGYSESVFLEVGDPAVAHIYTPSARIPFAGHPLVGCASLLPGVTERIRFDAGWATWSEEGGEFWVEVDLPTRVERVARPAFASDAHLVSLPLPYLVLELESPLRVESLEVSDVAHLGHVLVWAWAGDDLVRARFFAADLGVAEDPATGSAAVALARTMPRPSGSMTIHQGEEMGSPSQIRLRWDVRSTAIGGAVVDRGTSRIDLPD